MNQEKHERREGEMEIRILRDGRVVFIAPDDGLTEVAEAIDPKHPDLVRRKAGKQNERS